MSLLLHHPFIFTSTSSLHTYKTPSLTLSHTSKPLTAKWAAKCAAAAVSSPEISKEDGVLVGEEKDRVDVVDYDWTEEWYPLYLTKNIPDDAPLGLTVFDKQVVLYRDGNGELQCYEDRCPHRLAKLSEGQIVDGRLECLYHGWQFEGEGKCVKIPQANPMKLVSRIKKIQDELPALKDQCRELLSAKQDLIDKARTTIVGNRASLQRLQTSMGIPVTSDSDDPAFINFNEVIDEWTVQVRSRTGDESHEDSEDINKMLFSAIVQGN